MNVRWLGFILLLALLPSALATVSAQGILPVYMLGDALAPSATAQLSDRFTGFQEASIACTSYSKVYYRAPLTLDAGTPKQLSLPPLPLSARMKGSCALTLSLENEDGVSVDSFVSASFTVSDILEVEASLPQGQVRSGSSVAVSGTVRDALGRPASGTLIATLGGREHSSTISPSFLVQVPVPLAMDAGEHPLLLRVADGKGNTGELTLTLDIEQIPTRISLEVPEEAYLPSNEVIATVHLLDQADEAIFRDITMNVLSGNNVVHSSIVRNGVFTLPLGPTFAPGSYTLRASAEGLKQERVFTVAALQAVSTEFEEHSVIVTNIGNTPYQNAVTITLTHDGKQIVLEKRVSLKPGETTSIDLNKELESGTYTIQLPDGTVIPDVRVEDERSLLTKAMDSPLTGYVTADSQKSYSFNFLVLFLICVIGLALVMYFKK
ncbi:MAG: hypothetical protein Q7S65_06240 [Nanoarchaeota archaeon]|nr:hypothetical protein [Nanoarchaeota archaeon]